MNRKRFPFKRLFFAYTFAILPFMLIVAVLSLLGITPIHANGKPFYGVQGFFIAILLIPFFGIIMGALNWIFLNLGDYLYSVVLDIWGNRKQEYREE
ncbi:hypothetical protein [Chitinophaga ginsengisoli]|uniref:Uncharacterized protein n=1 Tax=Chitinophaga ginsengisoli TaxID=363837 RepID=A0A2P8FS50_9BACT|nr:hypothetical protein [Chitinophaga ginsengisoli]PSL24539.1 hypothetical protein CLV42_115126 [Chitinophaga ginsengisoli]